MDNKEFAKTRLYLGKSQSKLAQLLCVSPKAIQGYEQGWRSIPPNAERQLLLLAALKKSANESSRPCWEIRSCSIESRGNCPAWEFRAGHLCWFVNGTLCQGQQREDWREKIKLCRQCEVFQPVLAIS